MHVFSNELTLGFPNPNVNALERIYVVFDYTPRDKSNFPIAEKFKASVNK
jgi:hypothetical protein